MKRGLKVRTNHRRAQAPGICADLRPATLCSAPQTQPGRRFRLRGSCVRTGLVLARTFGPKWLRKMCILVRIEIHGQASDVATRQNPIRAPVPLRPSIAMHDPFIRGSNSLVPPGASGDAARRTNGYPGWPHAPWRLSSHRVRDSEDSAEPRPARIPSTLMSSSRSGQWMPSPPPIHS